MSVIIRFPLGRTLIGGAIGAVAAAFAGEPT